MKSVNLNTIKGFEDFKGYTIFEDGTLISYRQNKEKGKEITPVIRVGNTGYKYYRVQIYGKAQIPYRFTLSRLLKIAFDYVENHDELEVHHKDENTLNNNLNNLEWLTMLEHRRHTNICRRPRQKLSEQQIKEIREKYVPLKYHCGILAKEYNVSKELIRKVVKNIYYAWV